MALCAPPLYDKTIAYGLTGNRSGILTSVNKSCNGDGNIQIAKLFDMANLGVFLPNLSFFKYL